MRPFLACLHTQAHTCACAHTYTHARARTPHTCVQVLLTRTHTHTHAHAHAHTPAHAREQVLLALDYDGASDSYVLALWNANLVLTAVFTLELSIKLFGLGFWLYVQDGFNVFDAIVVRPCVC